MGRYLRSATTGPYRVGATWYLLDHGLVGRYLSKDLEKREICPRWNLGIWLKGGSARVAKHGPMCMTTKSESLCKSFDDPDMFSDARKSRCPVYSVFFLLLEFVPFCIIFKLLFLNSYRLQF